jgi:SOS-response transcriptional repressor LexA
MLAQLSIIEVCLPGETPAPAGIVLHDPGSGEYRMRFRRDWESFGEEAEVLSELADDFDLKMREMGADDWLRWCEDALSHTIRIIDREAVTIESLDRGIDRFYSKHVRPKVLPFITHLPYFSARVAAGKFLEDNEVEAEDWVETPAHLRLQPDMFVVKITGRSMEPRIPDGSLCAFRHHTAGSRQGKLLLIERRDVSESGGRYTVKRYRSDKHQQAEGQWSHSLIRLEPLNPEFEAWELEDDPDKFRVIGEFVCVIDATPVS